jgi:carboxylesterase
MDPFEQALKEKLGPFGFRLGHGESAVLMVHGLTGTPAEMRHFGSHLARKGLAVYCPQLAGHCASVRDLKVSRWQDWYRSIEDLYTLLRGRYQRVFVGGLSMGALISLLLAAEKGDGVDGLFLLSTTFFYDGWNIPRMRQRLLLPLVLYSPLKHFLNWKERAPYGIKDERMQAMVHATLTLRDANTADKIGHFNTPATVLLESKRLIRATRECLVRVHAPTLIVHSTEDDMASVENAHYVHRRISSRHVETFFVDDSYHVLTLDKRKNDVARRVAEFCLATHSIQRHTRLADCAASARQR